IFHARALSAGDVMQLYADPFAFLLPPKPRRVFLQPRPVVSGASLPFPRRRSTSLKPAAPKPNPSHPLTQGLVAWWLCSDGGGPSAYDLANNNTASFQGAPSWVPGQFGPAISLNGSADYLRASASPTLDLTNCMT